jgi:hypothetical protein
MKAISLWQPWATACMYPDIKVHETRHWPAPDTLIGQRFAVHAAKRVVRPWELEDEVEAYMGVRFGTPWRHRLPFGAIVGTATLEACTSMDRGALPAHEWDRQFGHWAEGRWAWRIVDPAPLATPIPWKGAQGWFNVPDTLF